MFRRERRTTAPPCCRSSNSSRSRLRRCSRARSDTRPSGPRRCYQPLGVTGRRKSRRLRRRHGPSCQLTSSGLIQFGRLRRGPRRGRLQRPRYPRRRRFSSTPRQNLAAGSLLRRRREETTPADGAWRIFQILRLLEQPRRLGLSPGAQQPTNKVPPPPPRQTDSDRRHKICRQRDNSTDFPPVRLKG